MRKVYTILKPSEINEALDFLSQENGIYHHDFMETHGKVDQCFICGQPPQNHINYEPQTTLVEKLRNSIGYTETKRNSKNSEDDKLKLKEPLIELANSDDGKKEEPEEEDNGEPVKQNTGTESKAVKLNEVNTELRKKKGACCGGGKNKKGKNEVPTNHEEEGGQ